MQADTDEKRLERMESMAAVRIAHFNLRKLFVPVWKSLPATTVRERIVTASDGTDSYAFDLIYLNWDIKLLIATRSTATVFVAVYVRPKRVLDRAVSTASHLRGLGYTQVAREVVGPTFNSQACEAAMTKLTRAIQRRPDISRYLSRLP